MSKVFCKNCQIELSDDTRFCPECGGALTPILDNIIATHSPAKEDDKAEMMKNNNVMGNVDVAGTKINAGAYNADNSVDNSSVITDNSSVVNSSQNTVYNQTIIDDTKKSVTCEISGRKVLIINSCQCPICHRTVSLQYYNEDKLCCQFCEKEAEKKYRDFYESMISDGGVLDSSARAVLNNKGAELKISKEKRDEIEFLVKKETKKQPTQNLTGLRRKEFDRLIQLVIKSEISVVDASDKLMALLKTTQDPDVQYWGYLLISMTSPVQYIKDLKSSTIDIYWQEYWAFLADFNSGSADSGTSTLESLKEKYIDKSSDTSLAEVVLLLKLFNKTDDKSYYNDAINSLKLIIEVETPQLVSLYKSLCIELGLSSDANVPNELNFYVDKLVELKRIKVSNKNNSQIISAPLSNQQVSSTVNQNKVIEKGFVLNDTAGAPLKVTQPKKSSSKVITFGLCGVAILAIVVFLFVGSGKDEKTTVPDEAKEMIVEKIEEKPKVKQEAKAVAAATTASKPTMASKSMTPKENPNAEKANALLKDAEAEYKAENYTKAIDLFKKAANLKSKEACLRLSEIYTTGVGSISANSLQAKSWKDKADKL